MATLKIEMNEMCLECPHISLVTRKIHTSEGMLLNFHMCEHDGFCQDIRKALVTAQRKREETSHEH